MKDIKYYTQAEMDIMEERIKRLERYQKIRLKKVFIGGIVTGIFGGIMLYSAYLDFFIL